MTRKQEFLNRACNQFGLQLQTNISFVTPSGKKLVADAVISQPNRNFKMFIFGEAPNLSELEFVTGQGCGFTSFGEPLENEDFEIETYAEMFRDWGFSL